MFYIVLYREKHENILSETTRPGALIFGMSHHLVNLCQVCSIHMLGAKMARPRGLMYYIGFFRENTKKSSDTIGLRAFIFSM